MNINIELNPELWEELHAEAIRQSKVGEVVLTEDIIEHLLYLYSMDYIALMKKIDDIDKIMDVEHE